MTTNLTLIEKQAFIKLFNKSGYVLDFSNATFGKFTIASIGYDVQEKFGGSKGASLGKFIYSKDSSKVTRLLKDLIDYYPRANLSEKSKVQDQELFKFCKQAIEKVKINEYNLLSQQFAVKVNSEYISLQLDLMLSLQKDNPTEAIGKAKELIESCCKTILEGLNESYDKNDNINILMDKTINKLSLSPKKIKDTQKASTTIRQVLGNLRAIASGIAELRNPYGSGHGKPANYKGLQERHAKLAIGSSITLVNFLWDSYELQQGENDEI